MQLQNAEIKVLSSRLDEKSEQVAALIATVQLHAQLPDHGQHDPEQLEHHVARARASARTAHEKHRKQAGRARFSLFVSFVLSCLRAVRVVVLQVSKMQKAESIKILRAVMGKHAHQHRHGFKHPPDANNTSDPEPMPSDVKKSLEMRAGLIERGEASLTGSVRTVLHNTQACSLMKTEVQATLRGSWTPPCPQRILSGLSRMPTMKRRTKCLLWRIR